MSSVKNVSTLYLLHIICPQEISTDSSTMEPSVSKSAANSLSSDFFYGWDLLFKTIDGKLDKKADILMVLAHFLLTKHYKFRCIGIGDDVSSNRFYMY